MKMYALLLFTCLMMIFTPVSIFKCIKNFNRTNFFVVFIQCCLNAVFLIVNMIFFKISIKEIITIYLVLNIVIGISVFSLIKSLDNQLKNCKDFFKNRSLKSKVIERFFKNTNINFQNLNKKDRFEKFLKWKGSSIENFIILDFNIEEKNTDIKNRQNSWFDKELYNLCTRNKEVLITYLGNNMVAIGVEFLNENEEVKKELHDAFYKIINEYIVYRGGLTKEKCSHKILRQLKLTTRLQYFDKELVVKNDIVKRKKKI